jgi:dihydroorotate dehydrogenase (NAD+) catalytic subunit
MSPDPRSKPAPAGEGASPPEPDADLQVEPELAVDLCGVPLATPIMAASGCFGFGSEMATFLDLAAIGGVVTKSVSLEPRRGRPTPRMAETPSGMLNAIGLQNPGVEEFCRTDLQFLREAGARVAVSVVGRSAEEFARVAERLAGEPGVDLIELNLSCPNVDTPGELFAGDPAMAALVTRSVKSVARQPVLAKLSADVTDLVAVARACAEAGADGLTLINTLLGMAVDVRRRRPKLAAVTGGLSGPAIRPVAVRCVWQVASALPEVPIVGLGGVMTGEDAAEMLLVGATSVQVGTANFINPLATAEIADGLRDYLRAQRIASVAELPTLFKPER